MIYVVVGGCEKIAVKESMDDALDVIAGMESFDKEEGTYIDGFYRVEMRKEA